MKTPIVYKINQTDISRELRKLSNAIIETEYSPEELEKMTSYLKDVIIKDLESLVNKKRYPDDYIVSA